jgi:hypothetical protein
MSRSTHNAQSWDSDESSEVSDYVLTHLSKTRPGFQKRRPANPAAIQTEIKLMKSIRSTFAMLSIALAGLTTTQAQDRDVSPFPVAQICFQLGVLWGELASDGVVGGRGQSLKSIQQPPAGWEPLKARQAFPFEAPIDRRSSILLRSMLRCLVPSGSNIQAHSIT